MDSVLYLDTDTLALQPLTKLWSQFNAFNESQAIGMAREIEDGVGEKFENVYQWYAKSAKHPFYGENGLFFICSDIMHKGRYTQHRIA